MSETGQCHCGAVSITIPGRPDYMNDCRCSLCNALGAHWGYFPASEVTVHGETIGYARHDIADPVISAHHCGICGATTHWQAHGIQPFDRMGINMRLFPAAAREGVELRVVDGPPGR